MVTGRDLVGATAEAAPDLPRANIIGEPVGRDTAAACALGAAVVAARDRGAALCVLTADHVIGDAPRFRATLAAALDMALSREVLVTLGIPPACPSTGFGYVEAGETLPPAGPVTFRKVLRFVEKPDRARAEEFVRSGRFFWNSGMFAWSVRTFRAALAEHRPALLAAWERLRAAADGPEFESTMDAVYGGLERISVDYAILEHARNIVMARAEFPWDDVGSWPALANHFAADASGNVTLGRCESLDSSGNVVVSRDRLTALIGVSDLVVVQAEGVTLVCRKDRAQDVKRLVKRLEEKGGFGDLL